MGKRHFYIIISLLLWIIVEYITVWHSRLQEWFSVLPFAVIQYLLIVLVFYYFLFIRKWGERKVFIAMIIIMYGLEFLWKNTLLFNPLWFLPVSLLLVSIWGFLTFMPFWFLEKSIKQHKYQALFYCLWILVAAIMGFSKL